MDTWVFYKEDGISSVNYTLKTVNKYALFTHLLLHIPGPTNKTLIPAHYTEAIAELRSSNPMPYRRSRAEGDAMSWKMWLALEEQKRQEAKRKRVLELIHAGNLSVQAAPKTGTRTVRKKIKIDIQSHEN